MLYHKFLQYYKHLSIFTKMIIPQVIALLIGMGYITYTYRNITLISDEYNTIKEKVIPALEKSENNILLLKQIANDFTFATLSSETDFLKSPKKYNTQIIDNLVTIGKMTTLDTSEYINTYRNYFQFTYNLTQKMIEKQQQYAEEMGKVLSLYRTTEENFSALNKKVQQIISNKTDFVSNSFKTFHNDVLLFGLILYLVVTLITFLVYKKLQQNFLKLISDISNIRQSGIIKEKLVEFSKNEFGLLAKELNAVFSDFNEAYQNLETIANKDKLTQLFNRVYMDKKIKEMSKKQLYFGIIIADIDHFKKINDTYGHLIGDKILQRFANILRKSFPKDTIICRWGGEEFLIVIPECQQKEELKKYAEKIRKRIETYQFRNVGTLTASFGCSIHETNQTFKETLEKADNALYLAKDAGRNCTKIC